MYSQIHFLRLYPPRVPNSTQYYHEDVLSVPFHDWTVRTHDRDDKQLPSCVSCEQGQTTRDEERWLEWSVLWLVYCLYVFLQTNFFFYLCNSKEGGHKNVTVREIRVGPARSESLALKEENTTDMQSTLTAINQIKGNVCSKPVNLMLDITDYSIMSLINR